MNHDFLSAFILLFLVLDPVGNLPLIGNVMTNVPPHKSKHYVIVREASIAFIALAVFMLFGQQFLHVMRLTERSLEVAGGVILLIISLKMIFPSKDGIFALPDNREPLIFPLAIPLIAGPSAFASVLLMASRQPEQLGKWLLALVCAMAITVVILLFADPIRRLLGESVVLALERLMGLILAAIAVEMTLSGLVSHFRQ